jgi:hypothetical protein
MRMKESPRVTEVLALPGYRVRVTFKDGIEGEVDLSDLVDRGPVFEPLRDPAYFRRVHVDRTLGTIAWPNGADVAPETLYAKARRGSTKTASL